MIRKITMRGIAFLVIAFIWHLIDDNECGPIVVYLFGHVWWHIFSAYAGSCIIALSSYIRADMYLQTPRFCWFPPEEWIWGWNILPGVCWEENQKVKAALGGQNNTGYYTMKDVVNYLDTFSVKPLARSTQPGGAVPLNGREKANGQVELTIVNSNGPNPEINNTQSGPGLGTTTTSNPHPNPSGKTESHELLKAAPTHESSGQQALPDSTSRLHAPRTSLSSTPVRETDANIIVAASVGEAISGGLCTPAMVALEPVMVIMNQLQRQQSLSSLSESSTTPTPGHPLHARKSSDQLCYHDGEINSAALTVSALDGIVE